MTIAWSLVSGWAIAGAATWLALTAAALWLNRQSVVPRAARQWFPGWVVMGLLLGNGFITLSLALAGRFNAGYAGALGGIALGWVLLSADPPRGDV